MTFKYCKMSVSLNDRFTFGRNRRIVRVIKVTAKGYNLLDVESGKCVLPRHVYDSGFIGKGRKVPHDHTELTLMVPEWALSAMHRKLHAKELAQA